MSQALNHDAVKTNASALADKIKELIRQNQSAYTQSLHDYQAQQSARFAQAAANQKLR